MADVLSNMIAFAALIVSLLAYLLAKRSDVKSTEIQNRETSREFGEKLIELRTLMVQDGLLSQRIENLSKSAEKSISELPHEVASHPSTFELRRQIESAREVIARESLAFRQIEDFISAMWDESAPSPKVVATLQKMRAQLHTSILRKGVDVRNAEEQLAILNRPIGNDGELN